MQRQRTVAVTLAVVLALSALAPLGAAYAGLPEDGDDGRPTAAQQEGQMPNVTVTDDDEYDGAKNFGRFLTSFIHDDLSDDGPRGLQIATFVLEHNPGNPPAHAGPGDDPGRPDDCGDDERDDCGEGLDERDDCGEEDDETDGEDECDECDDCGEELDEKDD